MSSYSLKQYNCQFRSRFSYSLNSYLRILNETKSLSRTLHLGKHIRNELTMNVTKFRNITLSMIAFSVQRSSAGNAFACHLSRSSGLDRYSVSAISGRYCIPAWVRWLLHAEKRFVRYCNQYGISLFLKIKLLLRSWYSSLTCWSKYPAYAKYADDNSTSPIMVAICDLKVSLVATQRSRSIPSDFRRAIDRST